MDVFLQFERLAIEATSAVDKTGNISRIVPYCSEILDLIDSYSSLRAEFVEAIKKLWLSRKIENGVIEFLCHVLQWQELKQFFSVACRTAKLNESWDEWQGLKHIVEAFEPDWEDAKDFYVSYFNN